MKTVFRATGTAAALLGLHAICASPVCAQSSSETGFPDVPKGHWAAEAVQSLHAAQVLKGQPASGAAAPAFKGDRPVTRYELALTLWRFIQYMDGAGKQKGAPAPPRDGAQAVRLLVAGGYLPANTVLARDAAQVTPEQFSLALSQVLAKAVERKTPPAPDTQSPPVAHPAHPEP